ncbi:ABC transporter permease [Deinococcus planocerae]|uniref:ABC transporter permease n=1 Tax=Deinococcus planocerae TaxID=1737569 RepID=UPI000C7F6157|nr:ABC transporter permease [Deinococcus planocerae]
MNDSSASLPSAESGRTAWWTRLLLSEYFVLYLTLAYFVALLPFIPVMGTPGNLENVLSNVWPLLAVAVGQTFVLIVAGIDLSQTAVMSLTSVVSAAFMTTALQAVQFSSSPLWGWFLRESGGPLGGTGLGVVVGILAMLLAGALIGLINGLSITRLRMPPFMVTLVTVTFFAAFALWLTKSENIINLPGAYTAIGTEGFGALSYALLISGGLAVLAHLLLSRTVLGRWLYATGANAVTARVSGVPVDRVVVFAYVFSGVCAAVGSLLYSTRLQMGRPTLGADLLLDVIGATVIGGTSLFGGKGKVLWTFFGVLFFVLLSNSLNLLNLNSYAVSIVKGAVILLAAGLDVARTRLARRAGA